ncbi:MAG: sigma-70 family RNA polymerase sigma factor, partial [Planctomycetota bacterium]
MGKSKSRRQLRQEFETFYRNRYGQDDIIEEVLDKPLRSLVQMSMPFNARMTKDIGLDNVDAAKERWLKRNAEENSQLPPSSPPTTGPSGQTGGGPAASPTPETPSQTPGGSSTAPQPAVDPEISETPQFAPLNSRDIGKNAEHLGDELNRLHQEAATIWGEDASKAWLPSLKKYAQAQFTDKAEQNQFLNNISLRELGQEEAASFAARMEGGNADQIDELAQAVFSNESPQGVTTFIGDGSTIVGAFKGSADFSTLIHETGHVFRRNLRPDLLKRTEEALEGVLKDPKRIKAAVGDEFDVSKAALKNKDGKWTREAEEIWARLYERYALEGKAPKGLVGAFKKISQMMKAVYKTLSGNNYDELAGGGVPDNIKAVFDDMFSPKAATKKYTAADTAASVATSTPARQTASEASNAVTEARERGLNDLKAEEILDEVGEPDLGDFSRQLPEQPPVQRVGKGSANPLRDAARRVAKNETPAPPRDPAPPATDLDKPQPQDSINGLLANLRKLNEAGDEQAATQVRSQIVNDTIEKYSGWLRNKARSRGLSESDAEDFSQDFAVGLFTKADNFDPETSDWENYIRNFALHNFDRKLRKRNAHQKSASQLGEMDEVDDILSSQRSGDLPDSHYREMAEVTGQLLDELPPRNREIVQKHLMEGVSQGKVGDEFGISGSAVGKIIREFQEASRRRLLEKGHEAQDFFQVRKLPEPTRDIADVSITKEARNASRRVGKHLQELMDTPGVGEKVALAYELGGNAMMSLPGMQRMAALFDHRVLGAMTASGQAIARMRSEATRQATHEVRRLAGAMVKDISNSRELDELALTKSLGSRDAA